MYDSIVVGAGIIGSATAYYLAKEGKRVLLLDQFPLPHGRGSSHGLSRAIRKTYTLTEYSDMMPEAYDMWHQLQKETGELLISWCGELTYGPAGTPGMTKVVEVMQGLGGRWRRLSPEQLQREYPAFRFDTDTEGIFDEEAGVIKPEKCLAAFWTMIKRYGGTIRDNELVTGVVPGDTVRVITSSGEYRGRSVVLTAGPWASNLLKPLGLNLPLKAILTSVCYWRVKQPEELHRAEAGFPVFSEKDDREEKRCFIYGMYHEYNDLLKICYYGGAETDPDYPNLNFDDSGNIQEIRDYINKRMPFVEDSPSVIEYCYFTMTPDWNFILDHHPAWKNIVVGAGFSGHGFKMAPTVGKILGQLACGEKPSYDTTIFKVDRFSKNSKSKL